MEYLDNETLQRVLSRVGAGPEKLAAVEQEPNLQETAQLTAQLAGQCARLARRVGGTQRAWLLQMERQYRQNYKLLRKMLGRCE